MRKRMTTIIIIFLTMVLFLSLENKVYATTPGEKIREAEKTLDVEDGRNIEKKYLRLQRLYLNYYKEDEGYLDKLITLCKKTLEKFPEQDEVVFRTLGNLSDAYRVQGMKKEADECWIEFGKQSNNIFVHREMAGIYKTRGIRAHAIEGDYSKAERNFRKAEEEYKKLIVYFKEKEREPLLPREERIPFLRNEREMEKKRYRKEIANAYMSLGEIYNIQGMFDEAIESYNNAIKWDNNSLFHELLARLYVYKKNDLNKGLEEYQKAIELQPTVPDYYEGLGRIYHLKLQKEAEEIKRIDPNHEYLKRLQNNLTEQEIQMVLSNATLQAQTISENKAKGHFVEAVGYIAKIRKLIDKVKENCTTFKVDYIEASMETLEKYTKIEQ